LVITPGIGEGTRRGPSWALTIKDATVKRFYYETPDQLQRHLADFVDAWSSAVAFAKDAFAHLKTIGLDEGAKALLDKAGVEKDAGVVDLKLFAQVASKRHWKREPKVRNLV
jgi:hypothetical protein